MLQTEKRLLKSKYRCNSRENCTYWRIWSCMHPTKTVPWNWKSQV